MFELILLNLANIVDNGFIVPPKTIFLNFLLNYKIN